MTVEWVLHLHLQQILYFVLCTFFPSGYMPVMSVEVVCLDSTPATPVPGIKSIPVPTRAILRPIMGSRTSRWEQLIPCRGKDRLGSRGGLC